MAKSTAIERWDVAVVGAGLSGMYQLLKLRQLGFKARVYEAGGDVGGTWYWNRYPGCRFDSESWSYGFSFSPEVLKEWNWAEHFSSQPENLRYCQFLADKFDLRRDITFNARVKSASWDEAAGEWEVMFEDGKRARSRFLITAIGPLSAPTMPNIPGANDFKGECYHTGLWPQHEVTFAGKRVAVIGTGASGVQAITEIAKTVGHLTVFQRTPNWCTPLRNSRISPEEMEKIRARYDDIFRRCRETWGCFIHTADQRNAMDLTPEEREAVFEELYNQPGFSFWQGNFRDALIDKAANDEMTRFVVKKIRARVKDQKIADKLIPTNHGYGTRRVPLESGYYEVYNQPNVRLVDLRETPIERITAKGVKTSDAEYEFDMIIFATGFDAITGAFDRIDIRGVGGRKLKDKWADGPHTYLGLNIAGFPNFLTLVGPHNAATFCNIPRCIEQNVDFVGDMLVYMRDKGLKRLEATAEAEDEWTAHVYDTGSKLLAMQVDSWITGVNKNVAGRQKRTFMAYAGGAPKYRQKCEEVVAGGYEGFALH
ncbi:Predicted flavoprotein CzcO associated with the cation diffusion facilitator CzcD [Enhydrobacter aerosaccus]|uniref:Predicted flavoprotein CzcO associated with the cation diffusion facilitator CzcD n=1 Tax=Enhydrobacter aerosaccus TaxID=225324 RepID=A0A1T4JLY7_9HYPH|nr:NAD(P)/FAD-dependent oxidoreductase [Enhydrobacter aerosaccus]SJZ31148.1 Predicted flavoprotein CzcO associated with the cation diffusion facilitator CzcD [Enhydrobacter aerosaccus]